MAGLIAALGTEAAAGAVAEGVAGEAVASGVGGAVAGGMGGAPSAITNSTGMGAVSPGTPMAGPSGGPVSQAAPAAAGGAGPFRQAITKALDGRSLKEAVYDKMINDALNLDPRTMGGPQQEEQSPFSAPPAEGGPVGAGGGGGSPFAAAFEQWLMENIGKRPAQAPSVAPRPMAQPPQRAPGGTPYLQI